MESLYKFFPLRKRSCILTEGRMLKDVTNVAVQNSVPSIEPTKRRKVDEVEVSHHYEILCAPVNGESLCDQPIEIQWKIFQHLSWPDLCIMAQTSRYMKTVVAKFICSSDLDAGLCIEDENASENPLFITVELLDSCHDVRRGSADSFSAFAKCLDRVVARRMVFSVPLFLETALKAWGITIFLRFLEPLICLWFPDVVTYVGVCDTRAFPMRLGLGEVNDIELESGIRNRFLKLMFDFNRQSELTKKCVLSAFLKLPQLMPRYKNPTDVDVANGLHVHPIRQAHKLMYCLFAPRICTTKYIDYLALEHTSGEFPSYGQLSEALSLLIQSSDPYWNDSNVFTVLEDLTTNPELWSMQSFVGLIIRDVALCVLTIAVRYRKGFHVDASTIFYYCVRHSSRSFAFELSRRLMQFFDSTEVASFQLRVVHRSRTSMRENKARAVALNYYHRTVVDSLRYGRNCLLVQQKLRASSV